MHRRHLLLTGLALLPQVARPAPAAATPRPASRFRRATRRTGASRRTAAAPRFKIVTRTFVSTLPITIPAGAPTTDEGAAAPYPSSIQVGGFNQGRILNVRVALLGLTHTSPNELDILLVAPGNVGVILLSDAPTGLTAVTGINLTFDQDAPHRLLAPLVSGTFQPLNNGENLDRFPPPAPEGVSGHSLTAFTNRNPNGPWRLFIVDGRVTDTGSLAGWSLTIRARVRVPHRHRPRDTRRAKR